MHCGECDTDNPTGASFCFRCGSKLVNSCAACGADLLPDASFCSQCGSRVARADQVPAVPAAAAELEPAYIEALQRLVPREFAERLRATHGQATAERRTVTILFADIVGSSAMTESLDPFMQ